MPICPVTKKCDFIVFLTKNTHILRRHFASIWPTAPIVQHVKFVFGLHTPVKFYPDPLRFVGVISENPICSDYVVGCLHAMHDSVQLEDVARKYHVMAALPNLGVSNSSGLN